MNQSLRITYITAGAAGMYCGSCMHDNTLVAKLIEHGHEALLVPTYTPIRTDEADVSQQRIFFGGVNVYLEQKIPLFRYTPWFLDQLLNSRWLLNWVSRFAAKTQAEELGDLTISMLKGNQGYQRKEIAKLIRWLKSDVRPQLINLTNVLLSGMVPALKESLSLPILGTLQGDDIFLEMLPEKYRTEAMRLIREQCSHFDGFVATSQYYADFMSEYLQIPRSKIDVIYPGINLKGHGQPRSPRGDRPFTIGYFARICPEKGFHNLVDAFCQVKEMAPDMPCRLKVSGWLGENNRPYFFEQCTRLEKRNLHTSFEHVESPDHQSKIRFLQSIDVLSVPTTYHEPKGLYILEALANGVPVVQPRHGSFPELVETTGGGLLVTPDNPRELAEGLLTFMKDQPLCASLGEKGKSVIWDRFHADAMARATIDVYRKYL